MSSVGTSRLPSIFTSSTVRLEPAGTGAAEPPALAPLALLSLDAAVVPVVLDDDSLLTPVLTKTLEFSDESLPSGPTKGAMPTPGTLLDAGPDAESAVSAAKTE